MILQDYITTGKGNLEEILEGPNPRSWISCQAGPSWMHLQDPVFVCFVRKIGRGRIDTVELLECFCFPPSVLPQLITERLVHQLQSSIQFLLPMPKPWKRVSKSSSFLLLVARMLLVVRPGAPSSFLFLVAIWPSRGKKYPPVFGKIELFRYLNTWLGKSATRSQEYFDCSTI